MPGQHLRVGIRREDKNRWETRVPLTPEQVGQLTRQEGLEFTIQPSDLRVFGDDEYRAAGAEVAESLSDCSLVLGVKEMPLGFFEKLGTYAFFAHVTKGQRQNMPMLARIMELGCSLVDYERIVDDAGRRLVFFGRFAGIAGMADTLAGLAQRLNALGLVTPLRDSRPALQCGTVAAVKEMAAQVGARIKEDGLPEPLVPLVIGVTGYGHVAKGALEVLDALGAVEIRPSDLAGLVRNPDSRVCYRVVFREQDTVRPRNPASRFDLDEYRSSPELYESAFATHLESLTALVNCIYWEERFPRLVTRQWLRAAFLRGRNPRLRIVGDISCDIQGAIEATVRTTNSGSPHFVYDPETGTATEGVDGPGLVIMAVDNLPCELPRDSSQEFGDSLLPFVAPMVRADYGQPLDRVGLPSSILRALVVHQGRLTPEYSYVEGFLNPGRAGR